MSQPRSLPRLDLEEDEVPGEEEMVDSGALIRWEKNDGTPSGHIALLGIRTIILCLVLCLGRVIQDGKLTTGSSSLSAHKGLEGHPADKS